MHKLKARTTSDALQALRDKTFQIQAIAKVFHLSTQTDINEKAIKFDEYDVGNLMEMIVEMGDRIYEFSSDLEGQMLDAKIMDMELREYRLAAVS